MLSGVDEERCQDEHGNAHSDHSPHSDGFRWTSLRFHVQKLPLGEMRGRAGGTSEAPPPITPSGTNDPGGLATQVDTDDVHPQSKVKSAWVAGTALTLLLAISACGDDVKTFEISNESTETVVLVGRDGDGEVVELATLASGDIYYERVEGRYCVHEYLAFQTTDGEFIGANPDPFCNSAGWVYLDEPDGELLP